MQLCQCVNGFCLCSAQTLIIFLNRIHKIQFVCLIFRVLCTFTCLKFIDISFGQSSLALVHLHQTAIETIVKYVCLNSSQQISHIQRYKSRKKRITNQFWKHWQHQFMFTSYALTMLIYREILYTDNVNFHWVKWDFIFQTQNGITF